MSELLPTVQASSVRTSLVDYLTTTFALADADARAALDRFLAHPDAGMFKGPYVRLRLPFRPADRDPREVLEWYGGPHPYGHQAAAFARLASIRDGVDRRPQPTLVTTGTGSGKTEAFLFPILDHVLRARRRGVRGTKALLLYPMNALANDQAQRLARIITEHAELSGVTAALYVGEKGKPRPTVTAEGLITDRGVIREDPPDILLTNYKMLDQLLLRQEDQHLWETSALSLQYLVLDEFHTYDGAQGTDVAMLLRRLGLVLRSHWPDDAPVSEEDRARPLGIVTPVATSATLGDQGDPSVMCGFAETVFGEPFGPEAVVTETRLPLDAWVEDATDEVSALGLTPVTLDGARATALREAVDDLGEDPAGGDLARVVLAHLYDGDHLAVTWDTPALLAATRAHPLVADLVRGAGEAVALADLAARVAPAATLDTALWESVVADVVAMLGHVRAVAGRAALSTEVHLWVRELTRIDRAADSRTEFRWGDDGPMVAESATDTLRPSFPAVYCRHCGRSGWMVLLNPVGRGLAGDDDTIRREHATRAGRTRALLHAAGEADDALLRGRPVEGLQWFHVRNRELLTSPPPDDDPDLQDGWVLPVLAVGTGDQDADKQAKDEVCPSCGQADGIRFLGSAIATLLSVTLSTMFGSATLNPREKRALVFTDSVQDAAHRAGFVQARSHTITFRAAVRAAVADGPVTLDELVGRLLEQAGDDAFARHRLLPTDLADRDTFRPFWQAPRRSAVPVGVRNRVRRRLELDTALELGLASRLGRTLELTGSVSVEIQAGSPAYLAGAARSVLDGFAVQGTLDGDPDDAALVAWSRGVLERMRTQGAIDHPWFTRYRREDGARWSIWGGRPRHEGMPAFPSGRPAPGYPRIGGSTLERPTGLEPVTSPQSWFSRWTGRVLGVPARDGGALAKLLIERLAHDGLLTVETSASGASVYGIPQERVLVQPAAPADLAAGRHLLVCDVCQAGLPGSTTTVDQLEGRACFSVRCPGVLRREPLQTGFYQRLYSSPDMRRVVAREHTSLLTDEDREAYETAFKRTEQQPGDPNVLVATPTLEMGIDIGDLSTVLLSSLPRTVASYLQRVGRAGRLTGNALDLAFVTGRGDQLPRLGDPLSVINGEVRPPATYLRAEEILRRQLTAHLADGLARDAAVTQPRTAGAAIGTVDPGSYLGTLVDLGERDPDTHVDRFVGTFPADLPEDVVSRLREWLSPVDGPRTSPFAAHVADACGRWQRTVALLQHRLAAVNALLPALEAAVASPAVTDDDKRALRSARAARALTGGQLAELTGEYWIGVLEQYGVFPNYTLLDDGVTLDVGFSWMDPDTQQFETSHAEFRRGAGQAIRELVPGATFYASGWEIAIDAVDLGNDGSAVRPWRFCPGCGYATDVGTEGAERQIASCPRCGGTGIADTGQRYEVVELQHVTAEVRRDEAVITDRSDDRERTRFQIPVAVDIDPENVADRWFVDGVGLGCALLRRVDLRWVNLGLPSLGGARRIAGYELQAGLFRVCAGCGKLDSDAGTNKPHEHRPWCPHRTARDEQTRTIALSRTLQTQGLLLRLPYSVTIGDTFAVPSLAAALLLGLREHIGGHPDHLAVQVVKDPDPTDGSDVHDAILLHDVVPGGTGYLAELADPQHLHRLLTVAWETVRDCECRYENRLACHRCLLPFALSGHVQTVSRASAERHLRRLLAVPDDGVAAPSSWTITRDAPAGGGSGDSVLEQELYRRLMERLGPRGLGLKVSEVPGPRGNTARLTGRGREWVLAPQVDILGTRPDFVLSTAGVPQTAIYADGRAYHASIAHNRLADDAEKRARLRLAGHRVIAVTSADLDDAAPAVPDWYSPEITSRLIAGASTQASMAAYQDLGRGALDQIVAWVADPSPDDRRQVARGVPFYLLGSAAHPGQFVPAAEGVDIAQVAVDTLLGAPATTEPTARFVYVMRTGALACAVEQVGTVARAAVVLDDRAAVMDDGHALAWRRWLELSNALDLRDWPTTITTVTAWQEATRTGGTTETGEPAPAVDGLPAGWKSALERATSVEREVLAQLARPSVPVPTIGTEGPDGIMLDLAWPQLHVVVAVNPLPDEDRADLQAAGWRVLDAQDIEKVAAVVGDASGEADA
ncbi:DEAD/DEAH box helicase [Cellulomonas sp. 179-A 9B4 NHS]|uniref:DEAD/DEAH box helicase n=1 Tax=Cellulomonas sp. 179-A 9B4 NHS TaxID=3142379 RepID=UPI00399F6337